MRAKTADIMQDMRLSDFLRGLCASRDRMNVPTGRVMSIQWRVQDVLVELKKGASFQSVVGSA